MFKDHLKISIRNLNKYRVYTSFNILGLSVGMAASILLFLVVRYERSFDKFHSDYQRIFRVGEKDGDREPYYQTRTPLAPKLKSDIPEVVKATRMIRWSDAWVETENGKIQANLTCVDTDFGEIFDFPVLEGDPVAALSKKNYLVISKKIADALFGYERAVGKEIREIQGGKSWIVGAVLENAPVNSTIQFELLTGWVSLPEELKDKELANWYNTFMNVYIELDEGASPGSISKKLDTIVKENFLPADEASNHSITLLPLAEQRSVQANNTSLIYLLAIVAIVILSMASVNFVNMATAQSLARTKEVAIRKVIGSSRWQLVSQFLVEAFIVNLVSSFVALILVYSTLPFLEDRFAISLDYDSSAGLLLAVMTFGFATLLGLLSGIFPAIFITSVKTSYGIKGINSSKASRPLFRNALLIFQFAASIFLITGTIVVWKQINYMKDQDLHFDADQVIVVPVWGSSFVDANKSRSQLKVLADSYKNNSIIEAVSFGQNIPGSYWYNYNSFSDYNNPETVGHLRQATVSSNYFETLGVKLLEGRTYNKQLATDSNAVVINKKALAYFGWDSIDGKMLCSGGEAGCELYKVVGVTEDFHYQSLEGAIEPTIHFFYNDYFNFMLVRSNPQKIKEVLAILENDWESLNALSGFSYSFLDDDFAQMYAEQERMGITSAFFSVIAILIASLGLFSVASFVIHRKRKEISIRKVMGASLANLAALLSQHYIVLVVLAFLLAVPFAYWLLSRFLEGFAYRIPLSWTVFAIAGLVVLIFAVASISLIVFRASRENPVVALRNE